jgi:hypothetical protein
MGRPAFQNNTSGLLMAAATAAALAFFCRGLTPTRFDTDNLPSWERQPPAAAAMLAAYRLAPPPPDAIRLIDRRRIDALERVDIDALFAAQRREEWVSAWAPPPTPGLWLMTACAFGRHEKALSERQDLVALRLMSEQQPDGYLGPGDPRTLRRPPVKAAFAENLAGLLAYYNVTRNPAAIATAVRAGDLATMLLCRADAKSHGYRLGPLLHPLLEIYVLSGERRYLPCVIHSADSPSDGLTQAVLYRATGDIVYLHRAQNIWSRTRLAGKIPDGAFTAELLKLTGRPIYAAALSNTPPDPLTLASVAFTQAPGGIAVSCRADSEFQSGPLRIVEQTLDGFAETRYTVHVAKPTKFALRLFVPRSAAVTDAAAHLGPPELVVNNSPALRPQPDQYATLARTWRDGDSVTLLPTRATVTASVASPAAHTAKLTDHLR